MGGGVVDGVVGGVVEARVLDRLQLSGSDQVLVSVNNISLSGGDHGLVSVSLGLSLTIEGLVSKVVVRRLVEAPGVDRGEAVVGGVVDGVVSAVVGGVVESLGSIGVVEGSWLNHLIFLAFWLSLSLSLSQVDSSDRVSQ